ncbi:unnamed protein product [Phytomonas sp. Hart1]|nr:unnamed protein product [Phytomonas sp. Hart1]|eukprot:CCW71724.1 unnamed protein product [Phytomonas sp. isolate Hart1]
MQSGSDEEGELPSCSNALRLKRIQEKKDNLPTLERLLNETDPNAFTEEQLTAATRFVRDLISSSPNNDQDIERTQRKLQKQYHRVFKKSLLLEGYKRLMTGERRGAGTDDGNANAALVDLEDNAVGCSGGTPSGTHRCRPLERYLVSKAPRSQSGVLVVTVFTSAYPDGQRFSCQWDCFYCPNEPGQPRSYLLNEPGVRRANLLDFDPYRQFSARVHSLVAIGHPADKVELLVLGGTWESYPESYRTRFIRDLFYAANTIFEDVIGPRRPPMELLQEQLLNESARCKIIGVTLETRPDTVNLAMLRELRRFGCTRVQIGVQHTDDGILDYVNRKATREDTIRAIKLLKDSCFKVDIHLMPDLPGSSPDLDRAMFDDVLDSPYLQADQWKIYPCQTTPATTIERWHAEGRYEPYGLNALMEVILYAKRRVHPWIRLNRIIRDIPVDYVLAGVEVANLRQLLADELRKRGESCRCIRCREVKGDKHAGEKLARAVLKERRYAASEGMEIFLSIETPDERTIFGFLRLRVDIRNWECPFEELEGCALVRELHVYGILIPTYGDHVARTGGGGEGKAQHAGVGGRLLERAEVLAKEAGYDKIAVISGVGARGYYRRKGYELVMPQCGSFMIKRLGSPKRERGPLLRLSEQPAIHPTTEKGGRDACTPKPSVAAYLPRFRDKCGEWLRFLLKRPRGEH